MERRDRLPGSPPADGVLKAVFPDGAFVEVSPYEDPREAFADWLIRADNPVVRPQYREPRLGLAVRARGLIHEPDDIRDGQPAGAPGCAGLPGARVLVKSRLRSETHLPAHSQLVPLTSSHQSRGAMSPEGDNLFRALSGTAPGCGGALRRPGLAYSAASAKATPVRSRNRSRFIPKSLPSITLADGSITSQFLEMFGRPARDTGLESERNNEPTDAQRSAPAQLDAHSEQDRAKPKSAPPGIPSSRIPRECDQYAVSECLSRFPTQAETGHGETTYLQTAWTDAYGSCGRSGVGADQYQGIPVPALRGQGPRMRQSTARW